MKPQESKNQIIRRIAIELAKNGEATLNDVHKAVYKETGPISIVRVRNVLHMMKTKGVLKHTGIKDFPTGEKHYNQNFNLGPIDFPGVHNSVFKLSK